MHMTGVCFHTYAYEGYPESIESFWISREPIMWPWCNLAASQKRPYWASVNNHSPVGLVSRQWDAVDWACVLCEARIKTSPHFKAILALGKIRSCREPNLGCRGADSPGWFDVLPKKKACTRAVERAGALMQILWSARSVIVHATATEYTSSVNGVSLPTD